MSHKRQSNNHLKEKKYNNKHKLRNSSKHVSKSVTRVHAYSSGIYIRTYGWKVGHNILELICNIFVLFQYNLLLLLCLCCCISAFLLFIRVFTDSLHAAHIITMHTNIYSTQKKRKKY